jgi:hypothetical protein
MLSGVLAACGGGHRGRHASRATVPPATTGSTSTTTTRAAAKHLATCPLTDTRPPSGKVPRRPALAVKVENLPEARPQWGLDKADIVFEEPVEGGITRFIAVFQCQGAARIEPVRSGRLVDIQILQPLGKVLFAYAGAIQPVVDQVDSPTSLLEDIGINKAPNAYWRDPSRYAPHNLESSTAALYAAAKALGYASTPPPPRIFDYGPMPLGGRPAAKVTIGYLASTTYWTWDPSKDLWMRSYSDTGPAMQGDNVQLSAVNVVVMHVNMYPTQYVEDVNGAYENELTLTGSGEAWVFRHGTVFYGKWERPTLGKEATFVEKDGTEIPLAPGNTWVEYVPDTLPVDVTP